MNTKTISLALLLVLPMWFATGCGGPKTGAGASSETISAWHGLSKVDETLAHAAPSDAFDIGIMVSELSPPANLQNAEMVTTMLIDLKTLGQELKETTEADVPEHLEAMHVIVGKMLTEAGIDQHVCDHDHHGEHGHDAPVKGTEENGPEE